jgi:hypothetical protein
VTIPVEEFVALPCFDDKERAQRGVYWIIATHFVLIVFIFFTDIYPIPKFRVWGAFFGSLLMMLMIFTLGGL